MSGGNVTYEVGRRCGVKIPAELALEHAGVVPRTCCDILYSDDRIVSLVRHWRVGVVCRVGEDTLKM